MKKRFTLTKNGLFLTSIILLLIVVFVVIKFGGTRDSRTPKKETPTNEKLNQVVEENVVLKVKLLDFVSKSNYSENYKQVSISIKKGDTLLEHKINQDYSFKKALQLLPPSDDAPLLNKKSEKPTHEAYVLVLTGDIVEYKKGKESIYKIENAYVTYKKQSLVVESNYDSVYISSLDQKKEKLVRVKEYKETLNDKDKYMTMLQW